MNASDRPREAAVVGPHVVVSLRAAAAWAPVLRQQLRRAAGDGVAVHPFVRDVVAAFAEAAAFVNESERAKADRGGAQWASNSLMSVAQVAERAGITAQAVRQAARDERLPGRRAGRAWVFEAHDVDRWINQRAQEHRRHGT